MSLGSIYYKLKVLLVLVVLPLSANYDLVDVAALALCILDFIYVAGRVSSGKGKLSTSLLAAALFLLFWNGLIFILFDYKGISRLVQCACVIMCYLGNSWLDQRDVDLSFIRKVILLQLVLFVIWWPITGFVTNTYSAFYSHSNFLGGVLLGYLAILVFLQQTEEHAKKRTYYIMYLIIAVLTLFANSRSVIFTMAAFLLGLLFLSRCKDSSAVRRAGLLLICVIIAGIAFTVIYPQLLGTPLGTELELLSREYFNKNFFSGREELWKRLQVLIAESPFIGYGLHRLPRDFFNTSVSSHNLWLQTALQGGFIGVAALLLFYLNMVWATIDRRFPQWRIAVSFGAAFILHECLEASLTQNNFSTGIVFWFLIGLIEARKKHHCAQLANENKLNT